MSLLHARCFRCACLHQNQFPGRLFCVKAGGMHVDATKSLEIANIAVERLRAGDSLESVKSQVVAWRVSCGQFQCSKLKVWLGFNRCIEINTPKLRACVTSSLAIVATSTMTMPVLIAPIPPLQCCLKSPYLSNRNGAKKFLWAQRCGRSEELLQIEGV